MGCSIVPSTIVPEKGQIIKANTLVKNETFQTIEKIGSGNYGNVFLIRSNKTQKEYALKAINTKNMEEREILKAMEEVNILKNLNHPNIISFKIAFNSCENTKLLNIITEYVDNGDLNKELNKHRKEKKYFEENQLLDWLIEICLALQYIHEKEIIHRDIKPSNIFLTKNNTIKLGDFGISKDISIFHRAKTMLGTPVYIAPELIKKEPYSCKCDIWSLGATFCHLMTLELPFEGNDEQIYDNILKLKKNKKIMNKEENNYNQKIQDIYSKEFRDLIDEMMTLDPSKRPKAKTILEREMINKRAKMFLKENNFDPLIAETSIKNYEQKEEKELKDEFETENNKNIHIIIEEMKLDENNTEYRLKTTDMTPIKEKKNKYDFLRQMTFMSKSIRKPNEDNQ